MKNNKKTSANRAILPQILLLSFLITFMTTLGCEQTTIPPGETYHKVSSAWPLFDVEKSEGIEPDGSKWQKEKGDAICWLSTWEKEKKYDKDGFLIYRKERDSFFPLYTHEVEETKEFKTKQGNVLIFPYYSRRAKTLSQE